MPIAIAGKKVCARCGIEKPATNDHFSLQARRSDGLNPYCKECLRVPEADRKHNRSEYKTVDGVEYKTCTICGQWKKSTAEDFFISNGKLTGHCKECLRKARGSKKRARANDPMEIDGVLSKPCTKCGVWKPADTEHFSANKQCKNGLNSRCRDCQREYERSRREKRGTGVRKRNWLPQGAPVRISSGKDEYIAERLEAIAPREPDSATFKAYLITNRVTGEHYVGITERKIVSRWRQHLQNASTGKRGYLLHDAMKHYGIEKFDFAHIACAISRHQLGELEKQLIAQYDSVEHGYNQTRGGKAGEAKGKSVVVKGKKFISIGAAARHYKVAEPLVWQRVRVQKWSLEQALELESPPPIPVRSGIEVSVGGMTFPTLIAAARHFGIADSAVQSRLKIGWTKEQAFGLEPPPKRGRNIGRKITVDGRSYKSLNEAAQAYGLTQGAFTSRLRNGWTLEEAVGLKKHRKRAANSTSVVVAGNEYMSVRHACEVLGFHYGKISSRLQLGWTIEQAFDLATPPPPSGGKNGKPVTVNGVTYSSNSKAAKAFGIDPRMFNKRIKLGWTVEEALGITSRVGLMKEN